MMTFSLSSAAEEVIKILKSQNIEPRPAIGELESIVIFMKAAASKNRVADKLESLFDSANSEPLSVNH